ncbi:MAG TPA: prolipoprotein diacylglyceryl transferase family protein [Anaerolineales bacterium]|nr:prolipoprotein diacylglyceryl transferase family protein [Anaerolineales bacterium]
MFPVTRLGSLSLPTPELIIIVFFYLGLSLFERLQKVRGANPDKISNLILVSVFVFIIFGRLAFVLENFNAFLRSPLDIFSLNRDLFDPWLGSAGVVIYFAMTLQKQKLELWGTLDSLAIFFASLALGGSLANIASGSAFGMPSELPIAIELWGAERFPVQFLDAGWNLTCFFVTAVIAKRDLPSGTKFLTLAVLFSIGQIIAHGFRAEGWLLPGGFRADQIIYWIITAGTGWMLIRKLELKNG